jgi:uncharacterized protein YndB with AHSA1/START domain
MSTTQTYELFIRATPEQVFDAIADGNKTAQYFFGSTFSSSLEPNAPFTYAFPDGTIAVDGKILEVNKNARLVSTWAIHYDPSCAGEQTRVTWAIDGRGPMTKLTLTHDVTNAPNTARGVASDGWSFVLSSMKSLLETGSALPMPQMG